MECRVIPALSFQKGNGMTKVIDIKPMTIPVINHAYGIDEEYDLTEKATTLFEEISYEIFRCSHGLVKYEQDSFVRINEVPKLESGKVLTVPKEAGQANYLSLIHYLDWNRGVSIFDRVCNGFKGEFWLYGPWFDSYCKIAIRGHGYIPSMGIFYGYEPKDFLENYIWRLQNAMRPNDWPYEGDPRKWLSRLPEKYWGSIK